MHWPQYYIIEALTVHGFWSFRDGPFTKRQWAEEFPIPEIRMPDGSIQQYRIWPPEIPAQ